MKRVFFWITALVVSMFWAMTVQAQEPQDSTESVNKLMALQEVVIKGGLPNTRLKAGAMITRIEGTPLAQSGTLGEMLIKVPGMTGTDEAPEVLGKGSPLIYINGRKMRDASELKRLRSEDIRDVEVINNPGAQYDAQVRAVVRIRTRKQQGDGLSLDFTATNEHDLRYNFERPQVKLGANYRKNGVDVFGSVYYFHQDYRQYSTIEDITRTSKVFRQYGPYTMTWKNDQLTYNDTYNLRLGLVAQKSLLKDHSLTFRCAVLDCLQRNRVNESGDLGYNQFRQCNRFSTHKLFISLIYRLNATRSKYKGTGAGKEVQARMSS